MKKRTKRQWSKKEKKQIKRLAILMGALILVSTLAFWWYCYGPIRLDDQTYPRYIQQDFIRQDGRSRTGKPLPRPTAIVIHYVSNPGSTARGNRNFFNSADSTVSSHFVVGLEGEVIQCLPLEEQSSASNHRNKDTISIEVCHPTKSGKFSKKTYDALTTLTAWLCQSFRLGEDRIIRHYDVTGKLCPIYYVKHPKAWTKLKADVKKKMQKEQT